MTTIWPLPQIETRELSTIEETRPTALLTGKRAWEAVGSLVNLPLVVQAEPHTAEREFMDSLAESLPPQVEVVYGIGGGLVINGQLHLGIGGTGGELGHQIINFNGPICGCGNRGCLEAYASGPAIAAMGIKAVVQGRTTIIGQLVDFDINKITPHVIAKAAKQGDKIAQDILDDAGFYIGIAAANVCASVGPRKIVIAGGVSQIGDLILNSIRRTIKERVTIMPVDQVEVVQAILGDDAGVIGSALWAANHLG